MVPNVLTHLTACALGLLLGYSLCAQSRRAVRRRNALRWAFERASAHAERARRRESATRAELAAALLRERAARDDAESTKALAATLEAEVVAMRWERDDLQARSRAAQQDLDRTTQEIAALHSELAAVVRAATPDDRAAAARLASAAEPEERIRFAAVAAAPSALPSPATALADTAFVDGRAQAARGAGRPALSLVTDP